MLIIVLYKLKLFTYLDRHIVSVFRYEEPVPVNIS